MSRWLLAILVSCGRTSPFPDPIAYDAEADVASPPLDAELLPGSNATILNACGPTDGLAYRFRIIDGKAGITCNTLAIEGAYDEIFWFGPLPTGPGTFNLEPDMALGSRCTSTGSCTPAKSVTITLTTFAKTGPSATGSYTLRFADGSARSKPFNAIKCTNGVLCG